MSGGTMIALAADEIVMDANAVLGAIAPQLGNMAAIAQVQRLVRTLLEDNIPQQKIAP